MNFQGEQSYSVRKVPGSMSLQSTNNDQFLQQRQTEIPVQIIAISIMTLYKISEIEEHVIL